MKANEIRKYQYEADLNETKQKREILKTYLFE